MAINAENVPTRPSEVEAGSQQAILFSVATLHLCLPLANIIKALPIMSLQQIPDAPPYFVGFMNYRRKSVPIIDLASRLNLPQNDYNIDTQILLCEHADRIAGFVVGDIYGVKTLDLSQRQQAELFDDYDIPFDAVFEEDEQLIFMLNVGDLLSSELC
ncbi:chemotaxis protein CheW [Spongiibacter sp.]|uniref:chemotaxis protein CheW n=1 Tax=Spongiibacter sp. TaxID=2024860 RepID=UPI0035683D94